MVLVGLSVGWKVLVLTLGTAVPRWVIGDGLDLLPLSARGMGQQAKMTAMTLWDHPIERLGLVQALRVMHLDSTAADSSTDSARGKVARSCEHRSATVRAYTYFAIPYSEARTVCNTGVVQYRVFRPRQ